MTIVLYVHGKGGSAAESEHYEPLFPNCEIFGVDYQAETPWEAGTEIRAAVERHSSKGNDIILIANSIGAFFCLHAQINKTVTKAYFISPVVDIKKVNGVKLNDEWLDFVGSHPVEWETPTHILYGSGDGLVPLESIREFAQIHNASLTVMENGEHWFHTDEQMEFLDSWIREHRYSFITLRERPELEKTAAKWFHSKWSAPEEAYLECMEQYLGGQTEFGWYLCLDGGRIIGGLGVIENDFHDRKDLTPNICAVYTEEEYRCQGIAGRLLNMAMEDLRAKGISPVYLLTDHTGYYERYGWEFFCMAQGEGEDYLSRMYVHY